MKRSWALLLASGLLTAGCGIQPSGVTGAGQAPTGMSPGVTLYFVNASERLQAEARPTGHLTPVSEALTLLLTGPGESGLHTEIESAGTTLVLVTTTPGLIQLQVPLTVHDETLLGIDQIVCTALGAYVQAGGATSTKVQVIFTEPTPASTERRTCPLISPGS